MVLYVGISPGTAAEKLAAGVLLLGVSGVSRGRGTPEEAPEMGHLSSAPQALLCRAIPRGALLLVAPSQLVMSALKTLTRFSECFEPVSICPVTSVSPPAPHAEQDFSADSLLTTLDRLFVAC